MKEERAAKREVPVAVVEQRVSNLAQGCLCESSLDMANDRLDPDDQTLPTCPRSHP